ncbi:MAG TPA: cupin domain-containing protein [Thermoleophilaceae bacterium]|nr:cupin domain-containing protein [Thermoleophilaceae bacterium]
MSTAVPIVRQRDEGELMWFAGGGAMRWKATGAETGGAFLLLDDHMEQGKVTPMHVHPNEDEAIYVIDGELLVDVEGERHRVGAGGFFFAPRGVPHAFMVVSARGAHVISWQTPASGEPFYRQAGETVQTEEEAARPADWARLRAVAERSPSIEIVGPAPFADVELEQTAPA